MTLDDINSDDDKINLLNVEQGKNRRVNELNRGSAYDLSDIIKTSVGLAIISPISSTIYLGMRLSFGKREYYPSNQSALQIESISFDSNNNNLISNSKKPVINYRYPNKTPFLTNAGMFIGTISGGFIQNYLLELNNMKFTETFIFNPESINALNYFTDLISKL